MATTTNYGWTTPDDTALVKDGAAAIRTLGTSVDTTTKNLNPETTLGDISFRSSTSNVNTRLGIGSTSQVLTVTGGVPVWATPAGGGGMTLLSTTTLSGASTTISSISQSYTHLDIFIENFLPATDQANLLMRYNADAGTNRHKRWATNSTLNSSGTSTFDSTDNSISADVDNSVTANMIRLFIPFYTSSTVWRQGYFWGLTVNPITTTEFSYSAGISVYNQTTAISSLLFKPNTGNFTSGTVYIYGVK